VASREKSSKLFQYLREKGIADEDLKRIKSPAGLELGAETLPEIAFSVMAEIVQLNKQQKKSAGREEKKHIEIPVLQLQEAIDPICGMKVDVNKSKYSSAYESKTYYFCCLRCKESFDREPAQYSK
jgi:xanthine dehydrogenase accessory factor